MRNTLLGIVETLLNRLVALDPQAATILALLSGRCIEFTLHGIHRSVRLSSVDQRLCLQWQQSDAGSPDLRISGSVSALIGVLVEPQSLGALPKGVQIYGDLEVARQLLKALRSLQLDVEEPLSKLVGDVLVRQLGLAGRGLLHWFDATLKQSLRNAGETLVHEQRLIAANADQQRFLAEVHALRDGVARLEARIALLGEHGTGAKYDG